MQKDWPVNDYDELPSMQHFQYKEKGDIMKEYGYFIVSVENMNRYPKIKEQISEFSWIKNGMWHLEDVDAELFLRGTGW